MLVVLPPSESKRSGGVEGTSLDLTALRYPQLTRQRRATIAALRRLSRNLTTAAVALGLGPKSAQDAALNRHLTTSPTMPVIDRFDGVLYDALSAETLTPAAREFAGRRLVVHSALFGLVGALDPVPVYRLSADSRLDGHSLRATWRAPVAALLAATDGLLLDLRSEGYAGLGPLPQRPDAVFVRVVSDDGTGRRRALNHFNKHAKGDFTRRLLESGVDHPDLGSLLDWAAGESIDLTPGAPGELDLIV